jgi:hypothetical protein
MLVGAYQDALHVLRPECGSGSDELRHTLDRVKIFLGEIEKLWHNGCHGCMLLVCESGKAVPHLKEFVADDGVHINQVEFLYPLVNPRVQEFCGLTKPGLGQFV